MIDYEWLLPIAKTWAHLIFGASATIVFIVVGMVFGRWVESVLNQINERNRDGR